MIKFRILTLANNKHRSLDEQVAEYIKRMSPWAKITAVAPRIKPTSDKTTQIARESIAVLNAVKSGEFLAILDENGTLMNSYDFAAKIEQWASTIKGSLTFAIGGNYGWGDDVRRRANVTLSLSKMTFTSEIARLVLYEQLYRALTIRAGAAYHHA